ncbi:hypothetical protein [Neisseria meningitidis]|uniref:hypothetical protein n=1 Tax=Neisseria meningitidis TaxID=487 RepID=UPI000A9E7342|nr:hypothetical protein [Neisseria meningitidis]
MPSENLSDGIFASGSAYFVQSYSGLTKIRKRRQAADSKNSTGTDSLVFSTLENRSL